MATFTITAASTGLQIVDDSGQSRIFSAPDLKLNTIAIWPRSAPTIDIRSATGLVQIALTDTVTVGGVAGAGTLSALFDQIKAILPTVGGSTGPATYLGQVGTRCYLPTKIYTNNSQTMSRSHHGARDNITSLQVGIPNWYVKESDGTNAESSPTASATITASVEYPVGTFTQLKFGGVATATGLAGTNTISDLLPISIPKGAIYFIRIFRICANNALTNAQAYDATSGDCCEIAASGLTDKTMGGSISNGFSEGFFPAFIVGMTTRPSALLIGDSRVLGNRGFNVDGSSDQGNLAPSVGPFMGYINAGVSGDSAGHFVAQNAKRVALAQYVSTVLYAYGINDVIAFGRTSAQVIADLTTIAGLFSTKKVFGATIEPYSTDATTVRSDNSSVVTINKAIRANLPNVNGYFDLSDAVSTGRDTGLWKTGYSTDFLHANATGTLATKNSGVVNPAIVQ